MRVLVTGSHKRSDRTFVYDKLDRLHAFRPISAIIQGGAKHVDAVAASWSWDRLRQRSDEYKADWDQFGDPAGPIRNTRMLVEGKPDVVMAFWGESGTANMVNQTIAAIEKHKAQIALIDWRRTGQPMLIVPIPHMLDGFEP